MSDVAMTMIFLMTKIGMVLTWRGARDAGSVTFHMAKVSCRRRLILNAKLSRMSAQHAIRNLQPEGTATDCKFATVYSLGKDL